MKKQLTTIIAGGTLAVLAGCTVSIDESGDGSTIEGSKQVQRAALPNTLSTADNDGIRVFGSPGQGTDANLVLVCLKTRQGMWKKEINFGSVTLRSENGRSDCANTRGNPKRLLFRKAKFAGVVTNVGSDDIDLTGWSGGRVDIIWNSD